MTEKISLSSTVLRNKDHMAAEVDGELVLMSVEKGNYYGLDAIGADIWRRLEKQAVVSDLCAALGEEYDADADTIRRDVLLLLEKLAAEGLIEIKP
jgi:hypothetical protein